MNRGNIRCPSVAEECRGKREEETAFGGGREGERKERCPFSLWFSLGRGRG